MIPNKIHYCWFGENPPGDLLKRCMESWQRVLPDYQVKEWNETNSPLDNGYARTAYGKKLWSRLSNYVRMHALYTEGGLYLDTDVEVLKTFNPLLRHKCFLGFQVVEEQVDWLNGAVLGAQVGHPFIKRCMEQTLKLYEDEGEFYRGPTVITAALKEMGLSAYGLQEIGGVTVYPVEYFYPYPWTGKFSPDCIKESTYCVHHWAGSWLTPEQRQQRGRSSPRLFMGRVKRALLRALFQHSGTG
jgi:hypothetical protein